MRDRLAIAALILAIPLAARAAPPLAPGDLVVAGFPYTWLPGYEPGPCDAALCRIDPDWTTVTPISDSIPGAASILDVAIEGPFDVAVLVFTDGPFPGTSAVVLVDVATGDVTTLASGIDAGPWASIAAAHGRLFVNGVDGILEIDRATGAVSVLVPEVWDPLADSGFYGVDAEPGGASLVTAHEIDCFPNPTCWEFVRIDLGSGSAAPFDPDFYENVTAIDVAPAGNRFVYATSGTFGDGLVMRTGPSGGIDFLLGGECSQVTTHGVVSDPDGNAIVGSDGSQLDCPSAELERIEPDVGVIDTLDLDFGIRALDLAPPFPPACSDGLDNDDDGTIDWNGANGAPADAQCNGNPNRGAEKGNQGGCGLGAELALLIPALGGVLARRRRRLNAMRALSVLAAVLAAFPIAAGAAAPLAPGDIVVAGRSYVGFPAGACDGRICEVDATLATVTPISDQIPFGSGFVVDLAVENPKSVIALGVDVPEGEPESWKLLQVDVTTGALTTIATDLPVNYRPSVAAARGRLFATGADGILEIDRDTGAVSILAPGSFAGLDVEPSGASLLTAQGLDPEYPFCCFEFVRIDLATNAVTPLGELHDDNITFFDVLPNGDRYVFGQSGNTLDGYFELWQPGGATIFWGGEEYQASVNGIASDSDGKLLVAGTGPGIPGHEPNPYALYELERWEPVGFLDRDVLASLDADFAARAIDVAPVFPPACSDFFDNDGDGKIDWDGAGLALPDPQCNGNPNHGAERASSGGCGLGAELALLFGALRRVSRQRLG